MQPVDAPYNYEASGTVAICVK